MGEEALKKFGRYFLLDRIAQGGMAEIFRARMNSGQGAGRFTVIKRIITGQGENEEFVRMFNDEIELTANFNHPNVIQIYDWGVEKGQPFIAMEYIDGKNIRQLANKFIEKGQKIPIDLVVYLLEQSAAGLYYAHSYKDKISGNPLNVVHRNISPQNVLVSYDGAVKVIDFGVAKATTNEEATKAGVIKGKLSYLSPEQIACENLDGRSDLFALGIVLWELLTSKKLFSAPGENEYAVLKQIENCDTHIKPPSSINPDVPKELDYIVLKALAKDRNKRYQTCEEFQKALHKYLATFSPDFGQSDLSQHAKELFKDQIVEDRKILQKLNEKVDQLIANDIPDAPVLEASSPAAAKAPEISAAKRAETASRTFELDKNEMASQPKIEIATKKSSSFSRPTGSTGTPGMPSSPAQRTRPTQAPLAPRGNDGESKGGMGKIVLILVAAGVAAVVVGPQFGFDPLGSKTSEPAKTAQVEKPQTAAPVQQSAASVALNGKQIRLKLKIVPNVGNGTKIIVNNQPVSEASSEAMVNLDEPLEIIIERQGFQTLRREKVLASKDYENRPEAEMELQLEPLSFGLVTIHTTPSAQVVIRPMDAGNRNVASGGKDWVLQAPFEDQKFPVGTYQVRFVNEILGLEKTQVISVGQDKTLKLDVNLSQ